MQGGAATSTLPTASTKPLHCSFADCLTRPGASYNTRAKTRQGEPGAQLGAECPPMTEQGLDFQGACVAIPIELEGAATTSKTSAGACPCSQERGPGDEALLQHAGRQLQTKALECLSRCSAPQSTQPCQSPSGMSKLQTAGELRTAFEGHVLKPIAGQAPPETTTPLISGIACAGPSTKRRPRRRRQRRPRAPALPLCVGGMLQQLRHCDQTTHTRQWPRPRPTGRSRLASLVACAACPPGVVPALPAVAEHIWSGQPLLQPQGPLSYLYKAPARPWRLSLSLETATSDGRPALQSLPVSAAKAAQSAPCRDGKHSL